ncbi:MAG: cobalamin B12-binding domain-containing protein [Planctomycetes bacterium]|nr:cobalamin B12-binding domain-containing protein [Planctomycetota bacterium]
MSRKIRVLVAKVGLDGHDRGAKVIAAGLRDAGMEVIYSGLHNTPDAIVAAAVQEDVDVIGISILSGAHMTLIPEIMTMLKDNKLSHVLVTGGGIIPDEDASELCKCGVGKLFGPGATINEIVGYIIAEVEQRRKKVQKS